MSGEATGYVWRSSPYRGAALVIHLAIADVVNDAHGNEFWMSAGALARKARCSRSTAREALDRMVADGALSRLSPEGRQGDPVRFRFEGMAAGRPPDGRPAATPSIELTKQNVKPLRIEEQFARFWTAYPRKTSRKGARAKFERAALDGADPEAIIAGAERLAADPNLPPPEEARFIPHPTTWLSQGRWEDGPLPPRGSRPQRGRAGSVTEADVIAALGGQR